MIIKHVKEVKSFDVKEAYGQDAEGVSIRWISEKRTGGDEYLHNFALRYFTFKPNAYSILPIGLFYVEAFDLFHTLDYHLHILLLDRYYGLCLRGNI